MTQLGRAAAIAAFAALATLALAPAAALAAPPPTCKLFPHADLVGMFVSLPMNGSVANLATATTREWRTPSCFRGGGEDGCDRTPRWEYGVGLDDQVSSVSVPARCTLFLYEHPDFKGRKAAYLAGGYDEAYAGIPNDSASSARCDCKRADPSTVMPEDE